jgi:hypothetical protein
MISFSRRGGVVVAERGRLRGGLSHSPNGHAACPGSAAAL